MGDGEPIFFATPAEWREWLERHHADRDEVVVGFYKKGSGRPSITWPESVDQALCFGWIDGIRRGLDAERYTIRFTPRRSRSTWSAVNIARARELIAEGSMRPAGLRAFEARADERSAIYSYEQRREPAFTPEQERSFRANHPAWAFFQGQTATYRRGAAWWVTSAKREETRQRRLAELIALSGEGRLVPALIPPGSPGKPRPPKA